ncbi:MAG: TylF/MycF/NovP-related O-methyltransferase [Cyanobacteria bacterium J06648_16]
MADTAHRPTKNLLYEVDTLFNQTYDTGLKRSGVPRDSIKRRERYYNLVQLFQQTLTLEGSMAECGCWMGLSSYLFCCYARRADPSFSGAGYYLFDSFEGFSEPNATDNLPSLTINSLKKKFGKVAGAYEVDTSTVKQTLADFPDVSIHKGWLPQSLEGIPERTYRFVHVDVDLHEPTQGSIEYFYPRLVPQGMLVCDDYGSLAWPGAKQAVDDYCQAHQIQPLVLSTGQAVLWKRS